MEKLEQLKKEEKEKSDSINRHKLEIEQIIADRKKYDAELSLAVKKLEEVKNAVVSEYGRIAPLKEEQKHLSDMIQEAKKELADRSMFLAEKKQEIVRIEDRTKSIAEETRDLSEKEEERFRALVAKLTAEQNSVIEKKTSAEKELAQVLKKTERAQLELDEKIIQNSSLDKRITQLEEDIARKEDRLQKLNAGLLDTLEKQHAIEDLLIDLAKKEATAKKGKEEAEYELAKVNDEIEKQTKERVSFIQRKSELDEREQHLRSLYEKSGIVW